VLEASLVDLIAQRDELCVVVDALGGRPEPARGEVLLYAREHALLLGGDALELFVAGRGLSMFESVHVRVRRASRCRPPWLRRRARRAARGGRGICWPPRPDCQPGGPR